MEQKGIKRDNTEKTSNMQHCLANPKSHIILQQECTGKRKEEENAKYW